MVKRLLLLAVLSFLFSGCDSGPQRPQAVRVYGTVAVRTPGQPGEINPEGAPVEVLDESGNLLAKTTTRALGYYWVELKDVQPGDRLLVRTRLTIKDLELTAAKKVRVPEPRVVTVPDLVLVNPAGVELAYDGGAWRDEAGEVEVLDPDRRFSRVWAEAFDPVFERAFWPGDDRDAEGNRIISNGFLFITATDAAGRQVGALDEPVTVYFNVPVTHRYYLRDVTPDNGRYEVPMYRYDEERETWVRQGLGLLVDGDRQPIPESDEARVTTDEHYGVILVGFSADHFSTWNVDHPLPPCK